MGGKLWSFGVNFLLDLPEILQMISIVIPNYNSAELLKKNLPRLVELLGKAKLDYEIIVVDDASTDDSLKRIQYLEARIKGLDSQFQILTSSTNRGFASTVDAGIRAAKGEIVFTMKTDSVPEKAEYFQLMLSHFETKTSQNNDRKIAEPVFAVTAALKTLENGKEEIRGAGEIYFERGFFLHRRIQPNLTNLTNLPNSLRTDWPDGSASAFRKDLYLKLGGFDKIYDPFYWEDVDLGFRARKAGYEIHFEPKAILIHEHESGAISRHYTADQIKTISLRNQFIFVWKTGDWKHKLLYILWEPYHDLIAIKNHDWIFFKAYWWAVWRTFLETTSL